MSRFQPYSDRDDYNIPSRQDLNPGVFGAPPLLFDSQSNADFTPENHAEYNPTQPANSVSPLFGFHTRPFSSALRALGPILGGVPRLARAAAHLKTPAHKYTQPFPFFRFLILPYALPLFSLPSLLFLSPFSYLFLQSFSFPFSINRQTIIPLHPKASTPAPTLSLPTQIPTPRSRLSSTQTPTTI